MVVIRAFGVPDAAVLEGGRAEFAQIIRVPAGATKYDE
jgi:hypothetical protein